MCRYLAAFHAGCRQTFFRSQGSTGIIDKVNTYWQTHNKPEVRSFWDNAAYHTGNMEAYFLTGNENYRAYSETWAIHNEWKGAKEKDKSKWKYSYGESDEYVLFGDYQVCFQTYIDLILFFRQL